MQMIEQNGKFALVPVQRPHEMNGDHPQTAAFLATRSGQTLPRAQNALKLVKPSANEGSSQP